MVDSKMFIPKTIKVGYQKRDDTYSGMLAYVIYYDDKGKLRKEKSWRSWISKNLGIDDFENDPRSGFVLNKKVGGNPGWSSWDVRNVYVRVYDPSGFEFEISVPNLLFILQETSSIKGKGLEGEFVYAWHGTELVLLPVDCDEYRECVKHTERQKIKFDKNDMKEGYSYVMKDGTDVLYLGRHAYNDKTYYKEFNPVGKKHIFLRLSGKDRRWYRRECPYIAQSGFTKIAERTSSAPLPQFPNEYDKFKKSVYCGDLKSIELRKRNFTDDLCGKTILVKEGEKYYAASVSSYNRWVDYNHKYNTEYFFKKSSKPFSPKLKDGSINVPSSPSISYKDRTVDNGISFAEISAKSFYVITVVTERGKRIKVGRD